MSRQFLLEAMTADEISAAQSQHYQLDDTIRRATGSLTAEQKQKVIDFIAKLKQTKSED